MKQMSYKFSEGKKMLTQQISIIEIKERIILQIKILLRYQYSNQISYLLQSNSILTYCATLNTEQTLNLEF